MLQAEEQVLVIPTQEIKKIEDFQGISKNKALLEIISSDKLMFLPRSVAEVSPEFKQIIPYCLFSRGLCDVLAYERTKGGGEGRLHHKLSVGIGGHINYTDVDTSNTYLNGVIREINEELLVSSKLFIKNDLEALRKCLLRNVIGFINDDSNEVGQVHFGIVHIIDLEDYEGVCAREESMKILGFYSPDELTSGIFRAEPETWSQLCLQELRTQFLDF